MGYTQFVGIWSIDQAVRSTIRGLSPKFLGSYIQAGTLNDSNLILFDMLHTSLSEI